MTRRQFAFWLSFGMFSFSERLRLKGMDEWAAEIIRDVQGGKSLATSAKLEKWVVENDETWWWYERQRRIDEEWAKTGLTTPINKKTGQRFTGMTGYLDENLVPEDCRVEQRLPDSEIRARDGRPPSQWLRQLDADELRVWLKTIDTPAAGVSGMTFWTHLTRDHSFDPEKIAGLTDGEQARLHAAAHYGY